MTKYLIPLGLFVLIGVLLYAGLSMDPKRINSPLVGKPLADFSLTTVYNPKRKLSPKSLRGQVYLLNVWASWCQACRTEHPILTEVKRRALVPIYGLNYKDKRADAKGFIRELGNAWQLNLWDIDGRVGIDLGVYGVPETFIIDAEGIIRYKHIGPVSWDDIEKEIMPRVQQYRREAERSKDKAGAAAAGVRP